MNEKDAQNLAEALSGDTWHSGGGIWVVFFKRNDGRITVISDEIVCEYENMEGFQAGERPLNFISLH